ncbi:MAG TPA: sulfate adenylyltransferase subunit CysN [Terriglobales bacterium]|nr:sulfate adenylyltransferase subunit CysN [Terriglobales bacterium]
MATHELVTPSIGIEAFLKQDEEKELLRFSTAGSVDDGKSTLIGRLLYDCRGVYEDQLAAVKKSAINRSSGPIDFSLLTDGLRAEREQGITIDVAYRYFATARRKFIIADTPGHEQYTRNMATGASTADLAIILLDARNGVLPQSRRHAYIASLLGIPHVVVAVNKMDLVDFREDIFLRIQEEFARYLNQLGIGSARFIPISAVDGDNVVARSLRTSWYGQQSLLEVLETVPVSASDNERALRFPVQYVLRPDLKFRGYAGQVLSGTLRAGDSVMVLPSGRTTRVKAMPSFDGDVPTASKGMSVTVSLEDEIDISRGDMLVSPLQLPHVARQFEARLVWMHEEPMRLHKPYVIKHTTQQVTATVTAARHKVDIGTLAHIADSELRMNDIGAVTIQTNRPLFFDSYKENRRTGSFILIDPLTNATVAAGMIDEAKGDGAQKQKSGPALQERTGRLTPAERYARAGYYPATIWLTGRAELAYLIERQLFELGYHVHVLAENTASQSLPELAKVLNNAGVIAIVSTEAFDWEQRELARVLVPGDRFLEFSPEELNADDELAAKQVRETLEFRGLTRRTSLLNGEGI